MQESLSECATETSKKLNGFAIWLLDRGIRVEDLAKVLGVSKGTIYGWRRGSSLPGRKMAVRLSRISEGAVSTEMWNEGIL